MAMGETKSKNISQGFSEYKRIFSSTDSFFPVHNKLIHPEQIQSKKKIVIEYLEQNVPSYFYFHFTVTSLLFCCGFPSCSQFFPWNSIFMLPPYFLFFFCKFPVMFLWWYGEKYKHIYLIFILLTRMQGKYSPISIDHRASSFFEFSSIFQHFVVVALFPYSHHFLRIIK